jgi:hypothetical protein
MAATEACPYIDMIINEYDCYAAISKITSISDYAFKTDSALHRFPGCRWNPNSEVYFNYAVTGVDD